jgi:hypothetical protein
LKYWGLSALPAVVCSLELIIVYYIVPNISIDIPYNIVPDIFLLFCATCILYPIVIFNIIKVLISNFSERRCNMSDESKVSKAQQKAVAKYMKNNYDEMLKKVNVKL